MFLFWTFIWIIIVLLASAIVYIGFIYLEAKMEVKAAPREPMFECQKHGIFRKKHLIKFLDTEWCPMCIDERIKLPLDSSVVPQ